jgi:hypothetical protein
MMLLSHNIDDVVVDHHHTIKKNYNNNIIYETFFNHYVEQTQQMYHCDNIISNINDVRSSIHD